MAEKGTYGIVVFLVGLAIIGVTLYLAFGLYGTFISLAASSTQQNAPLPSANVSTTSGIVDAVISSVVSSLPSAKLVYYALALLALLLFANIGYKFAKLGVSMMSLDKGGISKAQAAQPQRKSRF